MRGAVFGTAPHIIQRGACLSAVRLSGATVKKWTIVGMLWRHKVPKIPRQPAGARKVAAYSPARNSNQRLKQRTGKFGFQRLEEAKKYSGKTKGEPGSVKKVKGRSLASKLRLPRQKTPAVRKTTAKSTDVKPPAISQKSRRTLTVRIPRGFTRMVAAALITCIFPWIIFLAISAGVYFSTSGNPWMVDTVWTESLTVGASVWALGFGVPLTGSLGAAATLSVIPLGLWIAYLWLGGQLSHSFVLESKTILWTYPFTQATVATVVGLAIRGAYSLSSLFFWGLLHGFAAIAYAFFLFDRDQRREDERPSLRYPKARLAADFNRFSVWSRTFILRMRHPDRAYKQDLENRRLGIDRDERSWDGTNSTWTIPGWVVSGVRAGWKMFKLFGFVTLILVLAQVLSHFAAVNKIYDLYGVSLGAGVLIWLAQFLYLPTVQTWALAWILGPGFHQGTGTIRSLTQVKAGPIPAVPILGALPDQTPGYWVLVVIGVLSLLIGYLLYTLMARVDFFSHVASFLVGALVFTFLTAWFCSLASGSIGAGRMSAWGVHPLTVTAMGLFLVWVPIVLVGTLLHPHARAYLAETFVNFKQASVRVTRQGLAVAKDKAKDYHSWNPLSADHTAKNAKAIEGEQVATENVETVTEDVSADSNSSAISSAAESEETAEIVKTRELPEANETQSSADDVNDREEETEKVTQTIPEVSVHESSTYPENDQESLTDTLRARQETFAHSRGALPADTEEIKDLATDWAERKTDEVIAKEQQELEKIKSSAKRLPAAELTRPAIKRSIFKRGRLQVGKPRRDADDTSTQAIEIPDQD
ncbi:cell division protein PerM [Varibaculum vaginae]|uniref:cell division protein PerM n=1 Tax=Varibaculum vaginae TaxID=2364797 RepID=UPI000F080D91|nr:DUF6350 family protein [Varibaculum vaginae]